jgi:UDP-3-O-[3-hydroxymyristoyl] glucosamine N-acyltransferase
MSALELGAIVLMPQKFTIQSEGAGTVISVENPRGSFAAAVKRFFTNPVVPGIAKTAVVDPSATISDTAHLGEFTVVGPGVVVGDNCEIRNHVVLGANVKMGSGCLIKSHAVIGEEGFGIDSDEEGNNVRIPHLGSVIIGQSVEIGSFTTVNSGTITPTVIEEFAKVDDHVHIAHNCRIGKNTIITACAEISGSVVIGERVWIAPNVSVREKLTIGSGAMIGIGAVVTRSIEENAVHFGNPAKKIR